MITRIFRVRINAELREEFEQKFQTLSVGAVEAVPGYISCWIGKPTQWAPDEYVMVSQWQDEAALIRLAGADWCDAHIPDGMEKFVGECWVHHYRSFDSAESRQPD